MKNYTATKTVQIGVYFAKGSDSSQATIYHAEGVGTRIMDSDDDGKYAIPVLSDTYTMDTGAIFQLTISDTGTLGSAYGTEEFGSGTAQLALGGENQDTFALNDYYLGAGSDSANTAAKAYVYTISDTGSLTLNIDKINGADVHNIKMSDNFFATRSATATAGTSEIFDYGILKYTAQEGDKLTYSITNDNYTENGAAGVVYAGDGTAEDATGSFTQLTNLINDPVFESNTYQAFSGATFKLHTEGGVGSETFKGGSATFMADGTQFYFKSPSAGVLQAYTATSAVQLGAYFTGSDTTKSDIASLYHAEGVGTRNMGEYDDGAYAIGRLSDTYTMQDGVLTLTLSDTGTLGSAYGTEEYTSGIGKLYIADGTGSQTTFALSDYYLGRSTSETAQVQVYTMSNTGVLTLTLDGTTALIDLGDVTGTRTETVKAGVTNFDFDIDESTSYNYTATGQALTYSIDSSIAKEKGADGAFYAGEGTRIANAGSFSSLLNATTGLMFESNTYQTFSGATIGINVEGGIGTETFMGGSATFTADGTQFYFKASGATKLQAYTATNVVTLNAAFTSSDPSTGELYHAEGEGTRIGDGTYTIGVLNSDTYTMEQGVITLTLSDTSVNLGVEEFTSGTGKLYVNTVEGTGSQTTFALSDYYLGISGASATATPYVYTASDAGFLTLNLGGDKPSIDLGDVVGLRSTGTGVKFTFTAVGDDATAQSYTSISDLTYNINAELAKANGAEGLLFEGIGTRDFTGGSTTATIEFNEDVYTPTKGTIKLTIENNSGTETFFGGTATFTAQSTDPFHFGDNTYSATSYVELQVGVNENSSVRS